MTDENTSKPLAQRLKEAREAKGWTKGRLDREAKLAGGSVGIYENEGREPSLRILRQLAAALGVEIFDLLPESSATS